MGRGYQPREVEVLGFPYGSSIQDQERNRAYFQEAYDLIINAIPRTRLRRVFETYHQAAEQAGWPDRLQRGAFKFGWDAEKPRG